MINKLWLGKNNNIGKSNKCYTTFCIERTLSSTTLPLAMFIFRVNIGMFINAHYFLNENTKWTQNNLVKIQKEKFECKKSKNTWPFIARVSDAMDLQNKATVQRLMDDDDRKLVKKNYFRLYHKYGVAATRISYDMVV